MISRRWGPPSVANKDANMPLVLLHCLLGDSGDWQPVIDRLPAIHCIALDLPGHGSHSTLTVDDFEQSHQWLCRELASRGIEHYLLVGYSLGGRLALYHASREPAGLVSLASALISTVSPARTIARSLRVSGTSSPTACSCATVTSPWALW